MPSLMLTAILSSLPAPEPAVAGDKPLTFQDLMKFRKIEDPMIARDGGWIAYQLKPDRGDGEVEVRALDGESVFRIPRGALPKISSDSRWAAAAILPTQEERDKAGEKKRDRDKPKKGMALLDMADGSTRSFQRVESFVFSEDGKWLAYKRYKEEQKEKDKKDEAAGQEKKNDEDEKSKKENVGATTVLRNLASGEEIEIPHVTTFAFDEPSLWFAYAVAVPGGEINGLHVRELTADGFPERTLLAAPRGRYTSLAWMKKASRLAFVAAKDDEDHEPGPSDVWMWDGGDEEPRLVAASADAPEGWMIPSKNTLSWTRDGGRLFFGYKPADPEEARETGKEVPYHPFDIETLLDKRTIDVWHWDDPFIIPHQKKRWDKEKNRTYRAVAHVAERRVVRLADLDMPEVKHNQNPRFALGASDVPYRKEVTWDGPYNDVYIVDLDTGDRKEVVRKLRGKASMSPQGRFAVYYLNGDWWLFDTMNGGTRSLTEELDIPFANEDHDFPSPAPGYGVADWVEGDGAVLIYDKFDIWQFPLPNGEPLCITAGEGRKEKRQFRLIDLDEERDYLSKYERLLLHSFHDCRKNAGFHEAHVGKEGVRPLLEEDRYFRFVAKAKEAPRILYTRESYTEFPDLWTAGLEFDDAERRTDANPQIAEFAWGEAKLVEWTSNDGVPLQGVLIQPGDCTPGKRHPVLVYFYRIMSRRLHRFNEPVVNHRPSFPMYASHGYCVFLPDIRFEIGRPGLSAVKALVPGVQKLVDTGVADPGAIGLHGHSWGGYQTAFVITQTDIFAAAAAGAPVSNMTSAYNGIRLGTGLARQFQYEKSQSRIGGSLDEMLEKYIENSPVFHARHIKTPLLIMFGDRDDAVPWHQGVELYLTLRRLGKDCIFLQYRNEPHHPEKYANKLDYAIKMKEFFDHHLKGMPAPAWMVEGVPYKGE